VAQFEREMILERQREGIAKAKGKYRGRKPISDNHRQEVLHLTKEGLTKVAISQKLGIGQATVYRVLASERKA